MAETLNNLHAVPFEIAAGSDITVTDSVSPLGRTVTVAAGWYRHLLGDPGAAGTASSTPKEYFGYVEGLLNAAAPGLWTLRPTTAGFARFTYVGGTGAASLVFASSVPRFLIGQINATLNFAAPGATATSAYLPTHALLAVAKSHDDTDYVPAQPGFAACVTVGGVVDTLSDGYALVTRRFQLINVPRRWTDRALTSAAGTPAFPEDVSVTRLLNVGGAVAAGIAPPWTLHQHFHAARGVLCAFTDDLQTFISSPTNFLYDVGYVHPDTHLAASAYRPAAPGFRARSTRTDVALTLTNREEIP